MSGSKVVLINQTKLKQLIASKFVDTPSPEGEVLRQAKLSLERISKMGGCGCKKGPKRRAVYEEALQQLRNLAPSRLTALKNHLNATTLNLGKGYQI